jgi:hypothetical protein
MDIVDPKFRSSGVSFVAVETTSFDFLCANPAAISGFSIRQLPHPHFLGAIVLDQREAL